MAYIGQGIKNGTFAKLDTSGNTYNGSNVTFALGTQVGSPVQLLVSHDGVIQNPGTDYTLASNGTQITFTTAPASGASIFIMEISGAVGGPMNRDLNGEELILDVDGDTSITADTDDQIDVKIAGADDFKFTANTFTANSGSSIVVPDGGLTFGSTAISSTAAELNILDGVTSTAAELNLLDGGTSVGGSITLADADGFVVNDGGTMKTIPATDVSTYVGGGGLQFISTTTATSSSGVNINGPFTTTYDHYLVTYTITFSSDGAKARVRFQNTSNAEQSDTYNQSSLRANNETAVNNFNSTSYFVLNDNGQSNFSTIPLTGHMYVSGPRVSDARCGFRNFATTSDAGREGGFEISAGHLNENTEISGIKIYPSAGSFATATIRIYGIANS
jgi:hypothetical protein